jgi:hypothetical protein
MTRESMDKADAIRKEVKNCEFFLNVTMKVIGLSLSEGTVKAVKEAVEKRIADLDKEIEAIQ